MNKMNGFYFLMGCKDVFVKTEKKNKTVGLAKEICEKMGYPASQNNVTELIRRLQKATYLIYYEDKNGYRDSYEVYGYEQLREAMKWLHSDEIKATDISIYKHGKDFENNSDDIIEVYKNWWK